ncbi:MAG: type I glyceraldehyde-3-phosphate dehydrogenase [Proteobacteria bacterium]|nr:type I glyceraldehyde-3-phosphate dehydrogenase [Pseudomonadota bacterium]
MTTRVAINGLGRIGRCVVRAIFEEVEYKDIELVAVNGPADIETHAHLLKYDSIHGRFSKDITVEGDDTLVIDGKKVTLTRERDPLNLPWGKLKVDVVLECTGIFTKIDDAKKHIQAGAKKVIISAPSKSDNVKTIVFGVNDEELNKDDEVISVGSCTTNCLAPVAKILNDTVRTVQGFMTTIHSYTNDQNVVDNSHKKDLRRARACAMSMIPTSTGAAKAIGLVLPELKGKLDGGAIRVPTANVSMVDLNFISKKDTSVEEINRIISSLSKVGKMAKILEAVSEPLVSIDFNHSKYSSCFDLTQTKVIEGNMVKVCSWYDNEWGFSMRMLDVANLVNSL